jgi:hypothetical protein
MSQISLGKNRPSRESGWKQSWKLASCSLNPAMSAVGTSGRSSFDRSCSWGSELPIQAPVKFELVINMKTAKALDLDVPSQFQQRADEVIE